MVQRQEGIGLCLQVSRQRRGREEGRRRGWGRVRKLARKQTRLCCCSTTWAESLGAASDVAPPAWHGAAASGLNTPLPPYYLSPTTTHPRLAQLGSARPGSGLAPTRSRLLSKIVLSPTELVVWECVCVSEGKRVLNVSATRFFLEPEHQHA